MGRREEDGNVWFVVGLEGSGENDCPYCILKEAHMHRLKSDGTPGSVVTLIRVEQEHGR